MIVATLDKLGTLSMSDLVNSPAARDIDRAKNVCAGCPAREPCLEGAKRRREKHGVWGGQVFPQAIKSERWLKRIERSLRRLGVASVVGRDFVYLDEETAEVRFGKVPLHRLSMFCNRLEDLAVLADDYPTRVPAPMVGGTNVWIETLHVQLNIFDTPDPTHD